MTKMEVRRRIELLLAKEYFCTPEQLNSQSVSFTMDTASQQPRIHAMAYRGSVIVCTSTDLWNSIPRLLQGRSRDEIFELPYLYGQTIHYVPDNLPEMIAPPQYDCQLLFGDEIEALNGLKNFDNSLAFDALGHTPTIAVYIARFYGKIVGVAGASTAENDGMLEVGVDVLPEHRNARLGTYLVSTLTKALLNRDILPFYSASVTNLGSQMVASRCGYVPAWVDTFGNTLDGSSVYHDIVQAMPLPRKEF